MPPPKIAKLLSQIIGVLLVLACFLTFLPNPILGEDGAFAADTGHAILLAAFGVILLAFSTKGESTAAMGLWGVAMLCLAAAILGWNELSSRPFGKASVFGVVLFNRADIWLHLSLAGTLVVGGFLNTARHQVIRD